MPEAHTLVYQDNLLCAPLTAFYDNKTETVWVSMSCGPDNIINGLRLSQAVSDRTRNNIVVRYTAFIPVCTENTDQGINYRYLS